MIPDLSTINVNDLESRIKSGMSDNGHAIISPSAANIWMNCIGSMVGLNEHRSVAEDNEASVEGTCAHMLLELALLNMVSPEVISHIGTGATGVCPSDTYLEDAEKWYQRIVTNRKNSDEVMDKASECYKWATHVTFPPDMRMEVAKTYNQILHYIKDGWTMIPEMKVKLMAYLGHSQCDGTSDVILYKGTDMIVVDLKYGLSIEVNPVNNRQMKIYAAGAIDHVYKTTGVVIDKLTLVISQSRINDGVWKEWHTTYADLSVWINDVVKPASIRALYALANEGSAAEDWYEPSESACRWCHRKQTCAPRKDFAKDEAIQAFTIGLPDSQIQRLDDIKESFLPAPFDPDSISDDELGELLDKAPFIIAWFKDAEKEALARTKSGHNIGGRKMVMGRVTRNWPLKDETKMGQKFIELGASPDDIYETKLKSPNKIQNSGISPEVKKAIQDLEVKVRGGDVMALENDTREMVNPLRKAQNAFSEALIKS